MRSKYRLSKSRYLKQGGARNASQASKQLRKLKKKK